MTVAERVHVQQNTPEWLETRLDGITAGDAAVIAGERGSIIELWALKGRLIEPAPIDAETQALFDEGHAIEPYLLDYWRRRTGRRARRVQTMRRRKDWPVAMSSPDGEEVGAPRGIELKMSRSPRWPEAIAAGEEVPGDVTAQVQWQMFTTGWEEVDVVVFLWGRPRIITVGRDDDYIDNLAYLARDFWRHHEEGIPPQADGSENARSALMRLHPRNNGVMLPRGSDLDQLAMELRAAQVAFDAAEGQLGSVKNAIRAVIGEADGFEGAWGRITLKNNRRIDWPAVAAELVTDAHVDLIKAHTTVTVDWKAVAETLRPKAAVITAHSSPDGPRVLRPTWAKEEKP